MSELPKPPESQPPTSSDDWEDKKRSISNRPVPISEISTYVVTSIAIFIAYVTLFAGFWGDFLNLVLFSFIAGAITHKLVSVFMDMRTNPMKPIFPIPRLDDKPTHCNRPILRETDDWEDDIVVFSLIYTIE